MAVNASISRTATGTGTSTIPIDYHCTGTSPIGIVLDFTTVAAVGTASVEFTFDDAVAVAAGTALWFTLPSMSGKTATTVTADTTPARFLRLNVTAYTSGTITLRVNQGNAE